MKKIFKSALSIVFAIIMVVTLLPLHLFATAASAATYKTGDIIAFGSYPQTKVTSSTTITALNKLTRDSKGDVTYNGSKYRRVYFTQYTPYYADLDPTADNSFQDDNGYFIKTVYWFKFEPVHWRVLSNSNGELFVMAIKILDSKTYNQVQ